MHFVLSHQWQILSSDFVHYCDHHSHSDAQFVLSDVCTEAKSELTLLSWQHCVPACHTNICQQDHSNCYRKQKRSMFGCLHWIRRSERVQQYYDALQLRGLNYFPLQERRSDGERRSVPAFRLQIGTGAQTFDEFLDDLPLNREITIH